MSDEPKTCPKSQDDFWGTSNPRDTRIQIYISIALGVTAFLTFCVSPPAASTHVVC
jgi:hypothetical protein